VLLPVTSAEYHVIDRNPRMTFALGSRLLAWGYALPVNGAPVQVAAVVDSRSPLPVLSAQYAYVQANPFGNPANAYSGFFAKLTTTGFREGPHFVAAYVRLPDGRQYRRLTPTRLFFLTADGGRFSASFLRALEHAPTVDGAVDVTGTCTGLSSDSSGVSTVSVGAVLLLSGSVTPQRTAHKYSAVWLLADGRPYPTRYDYRRGSFEGTIPTAGLPTGRYRVAAYALREDGRGSDQVSRRTTFGVSLSPGGTAFLRNPPGACADPLEELAAT
jgi:hypothetical protein